MLVIGASGFAGSHLTTAARAAGFEVAGTARAAGRADLRVDLTRSDSIERAISETSPDVVANLAGFSSAGLSFERPAAAFEVNTMGSLRVLDAVARHAPRAHVLCVSSGDIYGEVARSSLPATEELPPNPASPYAASKVAMELACEQWERMTGMKITVVRPFNHTGPGQSERFAASSFARQIAEAEARGIETVTLRTGNLELIRDFSDVRDIVRAYLTLLEQGLTGVFNICSGTGVRLREIVELLSRSARIRVRSEVDPQRLRAAEPEALFGSFRRLEHGTGWHPEVPLSRTVADLLEWWRGRLS